MTDLEIANSVALKPITTIAKNIGISEDDLETYGRYKAKVLKAGEKKGKLILTTAINPTPLGEGKTTIAIGLADGINKIGKNACLALREPSLGPVFGIKGGATGGGFAQIAPMTDINLHFNGDMHAITSANNLLSAMIDNHIFQGNALKIDKVTWHRTMDMNDRALRNIQVGIGYNEREDHFDITAASEIMALLCLSADENDLIERLDSIIVGYDVVGNPVTAKMLKASQAMAILLQDAIKPNLVQTLEGGVAFVHGGPFANIAHGCNSIIATKYAMSYSDYVVTEAGFGADLGAEKFLDIKCRTADIQPSCVVIVATLKALKYSGGASKGEWGDINLGALKAGSGNLVKHIENISNVYKLPCVVALNRYITDADEEIEFVRDLCKNVGAEFACADVWANGGNGAKELAEKVTSLCESDGDFTYAYELADKAECKIKSVATKIYGAKEVVWTDDAVAEIESLRRVVDVDSVPVCIAKTQYSLSDDETALGRPENFTITVRQVRYLAGAKMLVAMTGKILAMPGLPSVPNAENMTLTNGEIKGLF